MSMKFFYRILFLIMTISSFSQNQLWKGYYSYNETTAVTQDGATFYFATSNSVFAYDLNNNATEIYNTINGLKIDEITTLAYAADYKKLIVGSSNGKVALIDIAADKIYHLNDIYNKNGLSDQQKKINRIVIHAGHAYLATGYGITAVRLNDNHFGDTFFVGTGGAEVNVKSIAIFNNQMYAAAENEGLKKANLNANLIDYNNWQVIDFGNWLDVLTFENQLVGVKEDLSLNTIAVNNTIAQVGEVWGGFQRLNSTNGKLVEVAEETVRLLETDFSVSADLILPYAQKGGLRDAIYANNSFFVASNQQGALKILVQDKDNREKLSPSGPLSNNVFSISIHNNDLWFTFGGYGASMNPYLPFGLTMYGLSYMKGFQTWETISTDELNDMKATVNVSFNPQSPNKAYISSFYSGLGVMDLSSKNISIYNGDNSNALTSITTNDTRLNGVAFDKNGVGWLTNSGVKPQLISIDKNDQLSAYSASALENTSTNNFYLAPIIDKNGTKWIGSLYDGLFAFNEVQNNRSMHIGSGNNLPSDNVRALAIDYNNQLWIGTSRGLRILSNVDQFLSSNQLTPTNIVIEDDGLAQELFYEQDILAITVDGSNNKWVSIAESGVFLISANGSETIYKFTAENTPLPSNEILSIAVDGITGEVFFGSRKGVVSFKNYATTPTKNLDNIKVYPNPVRPDFTGEVKISGLVSNATVKITDVSGNLVYETRSFGGTVTWNTYSFSGSKVPSGVYMIFVNSDDGSLSEVKKLMIIR